MKLRIESGVPIPPLTREHSALSRLLRRMKKSQSVFVPGKTIDSARSHAHLILGKSNYQCRREVRKGVTGTRIWRTQ